MHVYLAECPNCLHQFEITDQSLLHQQSQSGDFISCPQCKTFFSVTDHLQLLTTNSAIQSTQTLKNHPQPHTHFKATDELLFDDNSGLDEDDLSNIIISSTETMSPIIQQSSALAKAKQTSDFEIIDNFEELPDRHTFSPFDTNLEQHIDNPEDTQWLEKLLVDDKQQDEFGSPSSIKPNKKPEYGEQKFADIFDKLDVEIENESQIDPTIYRKRLDERFSQSSSTQSQANANSLPMTLVWSIGSVLLLVTLFLQYGIFNIDNIIKDKPTAERLAHFCQSFSLPCSLPIADSTLIDTQVLKLNTASKHTNQTDLTFTLNNTTTNKILYPNIKISLRAGNHVLAQSILTTKDYIEQGNNYLMPNQIKPLKLRIDFPKNKIEQANIELFY